MRNIPVRNVYYLLMYAWDKLEEGDVRDAGADGVGNATDLLAKMLDSAVRRLLQRGFDRGYVTHRATLVGVRGCIDVGVTLRRALLQSGRVHCRYDELRWDIVPNRIIKATIELLLRVRKLAKVLREPLLDLRHRLHEISDVQLTAGLFTRVQRHQYNGLFELALSICRLIFDSVVPDESNGLVLRDFLRDPRQMPMLFQYFVRNFYKRELAAAYRVTAPLLSWFGQYGDGRVPGCLPTLRTDTVLESASRVIIIDTKFSEHPFAGYRGARTITSEHLNQIFVYLRNYAYYPKRRCDTIEGILLYPKTLDSFHECVNLHGHQVIVHSIDLSRRWREIDADLRGLITPSSGDTRESTLAESRTLLT
jgi:5-methylcytosine-specific restriction enzyme subunit McrC